ncbi:2-hydroxy-3-oxopropionate reductase [candidate division KSB1 bacterium]|nr:NAD-binding protein [candidate division KSB1 bacterium]RQW02681.1 MAG: 2-hydroxy-3-oxopropionate reductase [candidate division KSB1 bacterium]
MEKIGFIGLGIMGKPMCLNLLKAGFSVTAWNRTTAKIDAVVKAGARAADSPQDVAKKSDIIITMVSDSPDVEEVILGDSGVVHGAQSGSVVIDMSTISPAVTRSIAAALAEKNVEMLDAPVSGGDTGAINGTLAIMVGGKRHVYDRCRPVFAALGTSITHVGDHGMGQTVKLCNQILVSVTNMAVCEAVTFASASGVDPRIMIEATKNGAAGSWQLANLGPKMVDRDFAPGFMIDLQQKDLRLALDAVHQVRLATPALGLVHQLFNGNQAHGEGKEGTQALVKSIERLAGR